jgi:hypothetical protein
MAEALKVDEDRHAQELEDAYLITRAKHRTFWADRHEPLILEGIPIRPPRRRRIDATVPPAPPPSEASEVESLLPLTQLPPREEVEEPQEPRNEVVRSNEVD